MPKLKIEQYDPWRLTKKQTKRKLSRMGSSSFAFGGHVYLRCYYPGTATPCQGGCGTTISPLDPCWDSYHGGVFCPDCAESAITIEALAKS